MTLGARQDLYGIQEDSTPKCGKLIPFKTESNYSSSIGYQVVLNNNRKIFENKEWIELVERVKSLGSLNSDWDGNGSDKPNQISMETTLSVLTTIFTITSSYTLQWIRPIINVDGDGDFVCEWWNSNKKLTLYTIDLETSYTKTEDYYGTSKKSMGSFFTLSNLEQYELINWIFWG